MAECIIFNDVSLPFSQGTDFSKFLQNFFTILKKTNDAQVPLTRADEAKGRWSALIYSESFNFGEWLNNSLDRDERRRIKNVMTKVACPLNAEAEKIIGGGIFVLKEDDTITTDALGVASVLNVPCLSFPSHDRWRKGIVEILEVKTVDGTEITRQLNVKNITTICDIEQFIDGIRKSRQAGSAFLKELKQSGNDGFPNISFNTEVLKTFKRTIQVSQHQAQIMDVLIRLNKGVATSNSLNELSKNTGLDISGESVSTMMNEKHANKRVFSHPVLGTTSFEIHVKNFQNAKRLYIAPDYVKNQVCVGYFGNHLPTKSNPT